MGYCSPIWVSDYTYLGLLQNQLDFGEPAKILYSTESLYVRADMNDDGTAILQPVYTISAPPDETPAESEFSLEFVNDAGETVATYPVAARLAKGVDFQAQSIHVITPKPALQYSSIRLIKNGVTIGERTLPQSSPNKTAQPAVYVENGEFVLNWGTPQTHALVRYTSDQGQSWTTLGVDILEGELRMDPQLLPIGRLLFEIRLGDTTDSIMNITWEHLP